MAAAAWASHLARSSSSLLKEIDAARKKTVRCISVSAQYQEENTQDVHMCAGRVDCGDQCHLAWVANYVAESSDLFH